MTVPGIGSLHRLNRSKLKQTEASVEHLRKPKPLGMGLQVPRGFDPKVPKKVFVWPTTSAYGKNFETTAQLLAVSEFHLSGLF